MNAFFRRYLDSALTLIIDRKEVHVDLCGLLIVCIHHCHGVVCTAFEKCELAIGYQLCYWDLQVLRHADLRSFMGLNRV